MAEKVGFIGLGVMGRPMAGHIIEAGYELVVLDMNQAAMDELAGRGAQTAGSPKEVAEGSDIVITMLPDSPQVKEVVAGENGVLEGAREGSLVVDMSTISPVVSQELAREAGGEASAYWTRRSAGGTWAPSRGRSRSW